MSDHPEVKISANALLREMRLLVTAILLISSATWATPTSMSGSSHPAVLTSNPLTLAETAIDDRALVPQSDDVSFRFGQSTINGVSYTNALLIRVIRSDYPGWVEINAGRSRSRFLGDLGVPDDQKSGSAYKVDVSFDNAAPVFSTEVYFGQRGDSTLASRMCCGSGYLSPPSHAAAATWQ